jgi:hypothetical protein
MSTSESGCRVASRLSIVDQHIARENQHDLEVILRTFGRTARYDDEPWDVHYIGHNDVRNYYNSLLKAMTDLHIEVLRRHASNDAVIVEASSSDIFSARGAVCLRQVVRFVFRSAASSYSMKMIA